MDIRKIQRDETQIHGNSAIITNIVIVSFSNIRNKQTRNRPKERGRINKIHKVLRIMVREHIHKCETINRKRNKSGLVNKQLKYRITKNTRK